MTLLEEYFIRLVEAELREPIPLDRIEAMLDVSLKTARKMSGMVANVQAGFAANFGASARRLSSTLVETPSRCPPSLATLSLVEATMLAGIVSQPDRELISAEMVPLADAGLIESNSGVWHISDAGLAALALGTGLRPIMSDGPKDGEDVLVFGFIDGAWCQAISSRDDRPYRLGYLHKKGVGFGWARFWMSMPEAPAWAKSNQDTEARYE